MKNPAGIRKFQAAERRGTFPYFEIQELPSDSLEVNIAFRWTCDPVFQNVHVSVSGPRSDELESSGA